MSRQIDVVVQGIVGTNPAMGHTATNKDFCRFRIATTPSHREADGWVDEETMWMTAKAWGQLARNLAFSLRKGDPVVLVGRLSEEKWNVGGIERRGNVLTIQTGGHDLCRGETRFTRTLSKLAASQDMQGNSADESAKTPHCGLPDDHWDNSECDTAGACDDAVAKVDNLAGDQLETQNDAGESRGAQPANSGENLPDAEPNPSLEYEVRTD